MVLDFTQGAPSRRQMTIRDVGLELLKGEEARCINALSIPSSGLHEENDIHMYVSLPRLLCAELKHSTSVRFRMITGL